MCVYVCMYVCVCMCMLERMHTYLYMCSCTFTYLYIYDVYTYMSIYKISIYVYSIYITIYIYIHILHMYIYIHVLLHIYTMCGLAGFTVAIYSKWVISDVVRFCMVLLGSCCGFRRAEVRGLKASFEAVARPPEGLRLLAGGSFHESLQFEKQLLDLGPLMGSDQNIYPASKLRESNTAGLQVCCEAFAEITIHTLLRLKGTRIASCPSKSLAGPQPSSKASERPVHTTSASATTTTVLRYV